MSGEDEKPPVLGSVSSHREVLKRMEIAGSPGLMGDHLGTVALLISLQASWVSSHVLPAGLSGEDHASWDRRLSSVVYSPLVWGREDLRPGV